MTKTNHHKITETIFNSGLITATPTGIDTIDRELSGICKGEAYLIFGSSGVGKSILCLNILVNLLKAGERIVYYDLENGDNTTWSRLLRLYYGLSQEDLLNDSEKNKSKIDKLVEELLTKIKVIQKADLLSEEAETLPEKLYASILKQFDGKNNPRVIAIDPLQALENKGKDTDVYISQGVISEKLKDMSINLNTSIILLHHERKAGNSPGLFVSDIDETETTINYRVPRIEDIKGSQQIADYFPNVWGFGRMNKGQDKQTKGKSILSVIKSRNQNDGRFIGLFFDIDTLKITGRKKPNGYSNNPNELFNGKVSI